MPHRVIIIDDDLADGDLVRIALNEHQQVVVPSVRAAIDRLEAGERFEAMTLDMQLPGEVTLFEGLLLVRDVFVDGPIIVVSDHDYENLESTAIGHGAERLFLKADLADADGRERFRQAVDRAIARHRRDRRRRSIIAGLSLNRAQIEQLQRVTVKATEMQSLGMSGMLEMMEEHRGELAAIRAIVDPTATDMMTAPAMQTEDTGRVRSAVIELLRNTDSLAAVLRWSVGLVIVVVVGILVYLGKAQLSEVQQLLPGGP